MLAPTTDYLPAIASSPLSPPGVWWPTTWSWPTTWTWSAPTPWPLPYKAIHGTPWATLYWSSSATTPASPTRTTIPKTWMWLLAFGAIGIPPTWWRSFRFELHLLIYHFSVKYQKQGKLGMEISYIMYMIEQIQLEVSGISPSRDWWHVVFVAIL